MPVALLDPTVKMLGGGENITPSEVTISVGDILDLIEAGDGVANVNSRR